MDRKFFLTEKEPTYFEYMKSKAKPNLLEYDRTKFLTLPEFIKEHSPQNHNNMTKLVHIESKIFNYQTEYYIFEVILTPCNESHSMTYCEHFKGTIKNIIVRSLDIIKGLKQILPKGDFSVKIEDTKCEQIRFVHSDFVLDSDGNIVGNVNEYV